jgi:uncharacterized protein (TIGR00299 family) protein
MHIAILDCFSGISGDMTLSALLDLGVPLDYINEQLAKLKLTDFNIQLSKTKRHHISASLIKITFKATKQPERNYRSIMDLIDNSELSPLVIEKAKNAFTILGEAEAKIHNTPLEKIHFHEVGAVDSIIDLVGSIIGFEYLQVEKIFSTPVPLGSGFTDTAHGLMPVPSPAAIEILKDYPIVHYDSKYEMTTPTGATLLKTLSEGLIPDGFGYLQEKIGYGAGTKDSPQLPNLLRIITGSTITKTGYEKLVMVETNIDDMNPEIFSFLMEQLFQLGAKDVFLSPLIMKKGRPGTKLSVLTEQALSHKMEEKILSETTTLGLRRYEVDRKIVLRRAVYLNTKYGRVKVKQVELNGEKLYRPEFEECKKIAEKFNLALQDVYREIERFNLK